MIFQRSLSNLPLASFFISKVIRGGTSNVELSELQSLDPILYRYEKKLRVHLNAQLRVYISRLQKMSINVVANLIFGEYGLKVKSFKVNNCLGI